MSKVTDPESAVFQRFPSGGGFSNVFPRANFQKGAVANYLEKFPPGYAPGIFNTTGRGHPDVSANGYVRICYTSITRVDLYTDI